MTVTIVPIENSVLAPLIVATTEGNTATGRPAKAQGIFADTPMCTPKYLRQRSNRHHEYEDSMARMLLQVPAGKMEQLMEDLDDDVTKEVASVMATDGASGGYGYFDFLLQTANHGFTERVQVAETLADNYVAFFFGHAPPIFSYSGTLMNTFQDDWSMRMYRLFRDLGRGTQLARRGNLLHIRYDSMLVTGSMTDLKWGLQAGLEHANAFSFNFLVKRLEVVFGGSAPPTDLFDILAETQAIGLEQTILTTLLLPELGTVSGATQTYAGTPSGVEGPAGVASSNQGNDSTAAGLPASPTVGGLTSLPQ